MTSPDRPGRAGLLDRLRTGPVVCAEGYLFELERRGYVQAGPFVPEVVLDHPEEVSALHRQFLHAGSDVVEAFTYYGHRDKLRVIGKDHLLEPLNRQALSLAREVAVESGALLAGNVCNTNVYDPADPATQTAVRAMFAEQVGWAAEAGVDFVIGETFWYAAEALLALEVIREAGLSAVITLAPHRDPVTREGWSFADACRRLADAGADVVGLNCGRGPATMLPLVPDVVAAVDVPVAVLPVPYRTRPDQPTFQSLRDPEYDRQTSGMPFPTALDPFTCNRFEIADFTREVRALGAQYVGLCCGGAPHHIRSMAESLGQIPPASRYSEDMSKHAFLGSDDVRSDHNRDLSGML
ncbi:MAG: homocysteine S-methyltransferase family protein [Propionibacteriales bacterium]|nr:homocysteine S-methyltransferase family protein [Propionibacteriales bacterium]